MKRKPVFITLIPLVLLLASFKLSNNDVWCSAVRGGLLLQHGAPSNVNPHGWLYDLALYFLYETAGAPGIIIFRAALILAVILLLIGYLIRKQLDNLPIVAILLMTLCSAHAYMWESRELVSALLLLTIYLCTDRAIFSGRIRLFVLPVLLVCVWTNISELAFFAPWIPLCLFLDSLTDRDQTASNTTKRSAIVLCLLFIFAAGVTPFGYEFPVILPELRWSLPLGPTLWLSLFAVIFLANQLFAKFRPGQILLFLALAASASRFAPNFLLLSVFVPVLISPLFLRWKEIVRLMRPELAGVCFLSLAVVLARYPFEIGIGIASYLPYKMARFASQKNLKGNILNSYEFGCCLNWMLSPGHNVLIKGDAETYDRVEAFRVAARENKAWTDLLNAYQVESAFLKYNDTLEKVARIGSDGQMVVTEAPFSENHFPRSKWALLYWDDNGMVFVRRDGMNQRLLKEEYKFIFPEGESYQESLVRTGRVDRRDVIGELQRKLAEDKYCWRADRLLRAVRSVRVN